MRAALLAGFLSRLPGRLQTKVISKPLITADRTGRGTREMRGEQASWGHRVLARPPQLG